MITLAESIAAVLRPRATELAQRWTERARAATPRADRPGAPPGAAPEEIVCAILACLDRDAQWQGEVMRLAWASGVAAHDAGLSVHHVLRDADLLLAILLTAAAEAARANEIVAGERGEPGGAMAEAFDVARRLQRVVGLHAQAATTSYVHALVGAMRARWRLLRHDLRNPLGTIRSALSLMEDETLPADMRTGPRIRAMVTRNAGSLESLIATRLDDRVAEALVAAAQEVSLRDVALAVRRTLRDALRLAECEIAVDDDLPSARVDEAGLELTLGTLLLAAVSRAQPGDVLRVQQAPPVASRGASNVVTLRIVCDRCDGAARDDAWDPNGLALSMELAGEYGGRVVTAGGESAAPRASALELEMPLLPSVEMMPAARRVSARSRSGHQRDDVSRAD